MKRVFRLPWSRRRIDAELAVEFQFHLQERIEQFVAAGMSRADAEAEAIRRFGDFEAHRQLAQQIDEETMRQRSFQDSLNTVRREVGLAARVLRRTPSFSLIALATLGIGIGGTTAIFSVLDAVVLRPLPYAEPDRLVSILHPATVPGTGERKWGLSAGGYFNLRRENKSYSDIGMYVTGWTTVVGGDNAEVVRSGLVTASIFPLLGARPHLGRLIDAADDLPDAPARVVLSYEFWQRRFGADSSIVGKTLETSNNSYTIIGVAEPGLGLPMPGPFASSTNLSTFSIGLWVAMKQNPAGPFFNSHPYVGIARLKPGVSVAAAQREMSAFTRRLVELVPTAYTDNFMSNYNFRGEVLPLKASVLGPTIPRTMWALFGAVIIVLLIAVANVANLFLVRMDSRRREATLRTALGAGRGQMAVHYLAESLLLTVVAAIIGVAVSAIGLRALLAIAPGSIPRLAQVSLTWQSIAFAAGLAILIGITFGLIPILRGAADLSVLREGGRGMSGSRRQRAFRAGLVVSQVALALVLLASAGLMIRSFMHLRDVKPGYDYTNLAVFDVGLPFREYDTREKAGAFHRELQRRIAAVPGVTNVGSISALPLEGYGTGCTVVWREGRPYGPNEEPPCVGTPTLAPGGLEALRVGVRGRIPTWTDFEMRTQAVVVTKSLADRLWPGEDAIGKGIGSNGADSKVWYRIVGIIPEIRAESFEKSSTEAVFYAGSNLIEPNRQSGGFNSQTYVVRTSVPPATLLPTLQKVLAGMNPRVPFQDARTMDHVVERSMARTSFIMVLLGISAAVALLLSAVGLYGVISYVVTQRRFEIGVRIALGAQSSQVSRLVVMQSVALAAVGVAIGLVGAFAVTKVLRSFLFDVSPTDPAVMGSVVLMLVALAALASLVPAMRAGRIDPVEALRGD